MSGRISWKRGSLRGIGVLRIWRHCSRLIPPAAITSRFKLRDARSLPEGENSLAKLKKKMLGF